MYEHLLKFYFKGRFSNKQFEFYFDYFLNTLLSSEETTAMRIEYQHIGGDWKRRSIQYKAKNLEEIKRRIFSAPLCNVSLEKCRLINGSRRNHSFEFYISITLPIRAQMQLPDDERSYSSVDIMFAPTVPDIEERFLNFSKNEAIYFSDVQAIKFCYGLVFSMKPEKGIIYYASCVGSNNLTAEEREKMDLLNDNLAHINEKIWQTQWLNIISDEHIKSEDHLKKIGIVVGSQNIVPVAGTNAILIKLPVPLDSTEPARSREAQKLNEVFLAYDALLRNP